MMQSNTVVTELDLEDNWLEAAGAHYISDMLKENCYITHLVGQRTDMLGYFVIGAFVKCCVCRCIPLLKLC